MKQVSAITQPLMTRISNLGTLRQMCTTFLSPVEGVLTQSLTRCCENAL